MLDRFFAKKFVALLPLLFVFSVKWLVLGVEVASAHPGRTASDGCHYCRTNCDKWRVAWNVRHCHGGYSAPYTTPYSTPYITPPVVTPIPKSPFEVQGTQTQGKDDSFWTGLITFGILSGGLYWVIRQIRKSSSK